MSTTMTKVKFRDMILDTTEMPDISSLSPGGELHIEFDRDFCLNSNGLVKFIRWLKPAAEKAGVRIYLHACSVMLIQLINMVRPSLPEKLEVVSLFVPFLNETSDESKHVLFNLKDIIKNGKVEVPGVLDSQGEPMELDVFLDKYFQFLEYQKQ